MVNFTTNPEDPKFTLGDYDFSDDFFINDEIIIPTVENGIASPIEQINSDFKNHRNFLLVGHMNARSVPKHIQDMERILHETRFDVVGVSETFLKKHTPKDLCSIAGFKFFRNDRTSAAGGGVGIFVREDLNPKVIKLPHNHSQPEMLFIEIQTKSGKVAIGTIYKPPKIPYGVFATIQESLAFVSTKYNHTIICGDFNINCLDPESLPTRFFQLNVLEPLGFSQIIDKPTRVTANTSTLLDLILVSNVDCVKKCNAVDIPGVSDHHLVYMAYNVQKPKFKPKTITKRDFKNFNQDDFLNDIANAPWENIYAVNEDDLDSKATIFENYFSDIINKHAPLKTFTVKYPKAPWLTDQIKKHMDDRDRQKNIFNTIKHKLDRVPDWTPEHHTLKRQLNIADQQFKLLRNLVTREIRQSKLDTFNTEVNSKLKFAKQYHAALKRHNVVESKFSNSSSCQIDPNILNQAFTANNNAQVDDQKVKHETDRILNNQEPQTFNFRDISIVDVVKIVKSLKSNACGIDNISSQFLKLAIDFIAPFIAHIINSSFKYNRFPDRWKHAIIKPIPKNDNPTSPTDFRPISLLPAISKIHEKAACFQICEFFKHNSRLDNLQSAYKKFHSTTSALLHITDDIYRAIDKSLVTILILLDYSKAFDTANHCIILAKLKSFGFTGDALDWVNSYLSNRKQKVRNDLGESEWIHLKNGVPQGSILGPLLFLVLVSDLGKSILNGKYHMYADDTQIYYHCRWSQVTTVIPKINQDLDRVLNFSSNNCLKLNATKSYFIIIGSKPNLNKLKDIDLPPIVLDKKHIERKFNVKNLGVIFDETFSWTNHVNKMVSSAYFKMKQSYRFKNFLTQDAKIALCEGYILSHFNYCDSVYNNITEFLKQKIQKVQNSCTRFIFGLRKYDHISHSFEQLKTLNMEERRTVHGLVTMHKIVKKNAPPYLNSKIKFHNNLHNYNTRNKNNIVVGISKTALCDKSFFPTFSRLYNNVIDSRNNTNVSVETFRKHAKKFVVTLRN